MRQIARELGVRYVLEGSVRRAGDRLRITAQLVDGATGAHLWAEHFDGALADVFAFQDRITADVAMIVGPQIQMAEIERSRRERPGSVAAYDIYLQAVTKINKETAKENAEAYALLTRALALEPDNPLLLSHAAWALGHRHAMGWPPLGPDDRRTCADLARRALQRAGGDPTVLAHCGHASPPGREGVRLGHGGPAVGGRRQSEPPDGGSRGRHRAPALRQPRPGAGATFTGRSGSARTTIEAHVPLTGIAHAQIVLGDYAEALAWADRSLAVNTTFDCTYWMLVAANAHLGRMDEARRHLAELRRLAPEVTVASIRAGQCAKDPGRIEPILDRTAAGRAAGGIAFARVPSSGADRFSRRFGSFHRPLKDMKRHAARPSAERSEEFSDAHHPLDPSRATRDPKWQEPKREDTIAPEVVPGRLHELLRSAVGRLTVSPRPAPSRSRA